MNKFCWLFLWFLVMFVGFGCGTRSPETEHRPSPTPSSVNLAGLTFYLTHGELSSKLNMLRCSSTDPLVKRCRWSTTKKDREGAFKGIDEIQFTLYRDSVQGIAVYYSQMLDVEYTNFSKAVYEKYGPRSQGAVTDTGAAEWTYDSLIVKFIPNKRKHWTATMYTYSPVLEFQERMLYKRWVADVEHQKVYALY